MPVEYTFFDRMKVICPNCKNKMPVSQAFMYAVERLHQEVIRIVFWCQYCNTISFERTIPHSPDELGEWLEKMMERGVRMM